MVSRKQGTIDVQNKRIQTKTKSDQSGPSVNCHQSDADVDLLRSDSKDTIAEVERLIRETRANGVSRPRLGSSIFINQTAFLSASFACSTAFLGAFSRGQKYKTDCNKSNRLANRSEPFPFFSQRHLHVRARVAFLRAFASYRAYA